METRCILLLSFVVCNVFTIDNEEKVDYTKVVRWEKRTLVCRDRNKSNSTHLPADCRLIIGDSGTEVSTRCFDEKFEDTGIAGRKSDEHSNKRTVCDIQCPGADRDSVISKIPNSRYACVRWYNYNTLKRDGQWYMWRSDACRNLEVTLEVHCGFPKEEKTSKTLPRSFQLSTNLNV